MRKQYWQSWFMVLLVFAALLHAALGQETNVTTNGTLIVDTGGATPLDPVTPELPKDLEGLWLLAIMVISPLLIAALGKIPALPRPVLTIIGPALGLGLGILLDKMNALNLAWWHVAGAASMATTIREIFNQWVTKRLKPLELSKTRARPIDHAVAVNENNPAVPTRAEARAHQQARKDNYRDHQGPQ
jgi:hypothetical protein